VLDLSPEFGISPIPSVYEASEPKREPDPILNCQAIDLAEVSKVPREKSGALDQDDRSDLEVHGTDPGVQLSKALELSDDDFRRNAMLAVRHGPSHAFWLREYAQYPARLRIEAIAPIQNKVGAFIANPESREHAVGATQLTRRARSAHASCSYPRGAEHFLMPGSHR
jgi:hypothetical protein